MKSNPHLLGPLWWLALASAALAQTPSNDAFAQRIFLDGPLPISTTGTLVSATLENGEPTISATGDASVWWSWQTPVAGRYQMLVSGDGFTAAIAAYAGSELSALDEIDNNVIGEGAVVDASDGDFFQIQIKGFFRGSGPFTLQIVPIPPRRYDLVSIGIPGETPYAYSGHVITDGTFDDNITADVLIDWEITVVSPGNVDGVTTQILTPANSNVEFDRATSEARLAASPGELRIGGTERTAASVSSLMFTSGDLSLLFAGGKADVDPVVKITDSSEDPPSFSTSFPSEDGALVFGYPRPFVEILGASNNTIELKYIGILQESQDMRQWEDVVPQPDSPSIQARMRPSQYFRARPSSR